MAAAPLTEWNLLSFIAKRAAAQKDRRLLLGPGDDCALVRHGNKTLVYTTDEMVENTHFINPFKTPRQLARKLLRINLSDLASMGDVTPVCALCGASFPKNTPESWMKAFTDELFKECAAFGCTLAGGNLARAEKMHLYVTVTGELGGGRPVLRSGAKPGDLIFGVGRIGEARAGLDYYLSGKTVPGKFARLTESFWLPRICLKEGALIGRSGLASAMMDNSDGLYKSVRTIAAASGCSAVLDVTRAALSPVLEAYCAATGGNWKDYIIAGGEDYGLIFTVPPAKVDRLITLLPSAYALGVMGKGTGVRCNGHENPAIFEHF